MHIKAMVKWAYEAIVEKWPTAIDIDEVNL